jgi:hypothetical protein
LKAIATILLSFFLISSFGQDTLNHRYDFYGGQEVGRKVLYEKDSSYLIFSHGADTMAGGQQCLYVRRVGNQGQLIKHSLIRKSNAGISVGWYGSSIDTLNNTYFIACNYFDTTPQRGGLIKLNNQLDSLFIGDFFAASNEEIYVRSLRTLANQTLLLNAQVYDTVSQKNGLGTYIFDTLGNILYSNVNYSGNHHPFFSYACADSGYVIGERYWTFNPSDKDPRVVRYNKNHQIIWAYTFGGTEIDQAPSVYECRNGDILCAYTQDWTDTIHVARLSANGDLLWDRMYGEENTQNFVPAIIETENGSIMVAGKYGISANDAYAFMMLLGYNGDSLWTRLHQDYMPAPWVNNDFVNITQLPDGGYLTGGSAWTNGQDAWIVRTDSCGCIAPGCVPSCQTFLPISEQPHTVNDISEQEKQLLSVYPNPNSGQFTVKANKQGKLYIYNLQAKLVHQFFIQQGSNSIQTTLNTGIYLYEFEGKRGKIVIE